ncbi:hypothetical protein OAQ99_05160 [Candidatus Kapabacteria bacterium]|nr:hypothetical protein [Candidatus Kapabacteria bacterium]
MKLLILIPLLCALVSCERDVSTLDSASFPAASEIYLDGLAGDLDYQAFLNSKLDALSLDNEVKYDGTSSIKITVPRVGDPSGWFAGGVLVSPGRDLSGFNALTFYSKASQVATIGELGFGNDNNNNADYLTIIRNVKVTTSWQKFIIPIPNSTKLIAEQGIFQFSIGADENGNGFDVWFDEVQFENLGTLSHPQADLGNASLTPVIGDTLLIDDVKVSVSGSDVIVDASSKYLDFKSSNDSVLVVEGENLIVVGGGEAEITAKLGELDALGSIRVDVGNLTAAPKPNFPSSDVISIFSNEYTNVTVDSFNPFWGGSTTLISDLQIGDDDLKKYTKLNFVGIIFNTQTIDISEMTHFHLQFWTPDPSALPSAFRVEIIDFGADNGFDGGDDSAHIITVNASSTPVLESEKWVTIDIPISELTNLNSIKNIAQIVLSSPANQAPNTVYIDNLLFHK